MTTTLHLKPCTCGSRKIQAGNNWDGPGAYIRCMDCCLMISAEDWKIEDAINLSEKWNSIPNTILSIPYNTDLA